MRTARPEIVLRPELRNGESDARDSGLTTGTLTDLLLRKIKAVYAVGGSLLGSLFMVIFNFNYSTMRLPKFHHFEEHGNITGQQYTILNMVSKMIRAAGD